MNGMNEDVGDVDDLLDIIDDDVEIPEDLVVDEKKLK